MATGNDCPACGENIGIRAVFKASLPNRIWCPHCKTRLQYGGTWALLVVTILLTVLLIAGGIWVMLVVGLDNLPGAILALITVLVVGGTLLEVAFVLELWYGEYVLEHVEKPKPFDADDAF